MRDVLFCGLVFGLLFANGVPAVDALRDPKRYIDYQNRLIRSYDELQDEAGSRILSGPHGDIGVRIDASTKLIACGFMLVLMWKGIHRRPVRAMILFIGFLSVSADPPLAAFLEHQLSTNTNTMFTLRAAESVWPFVVASLLRFAVLFPRPLSTAQLLPHLSGTHPGMLRRAWHRTMAVGRHRLSRSAFLQILRRGCTRIFSRVPSAIRWFDAAIVFALAMFMFLTMMTGWAWRRNYQVAAAAAVIVVTRLIATGVRFWIRRERSEYFGRPSRDAGALLIAMYALVVATQPTWTSATIPMELVIVVGTIASLLLLLRGTLESYLSFLDLQLKLTKPFFVWSVALITYFVGVTVQVMPATLAAVGPPVSTGGRLLIGFGGLAAVIGSLVIAVIIVGFLLFAIKFLRIGYEVGDATDRQRVLWIVEGVAVAAAIQLLVGAVTLVWSGAIPPHVIEYGRRIANSLNLPVILVSLGVAVFYHGALEPSLIIRRTFIYSVVFIITVFVFEGFENSMTAIFSEQLGEETPTWLTGLIAAGSVALALGPIRHRCDAIVARYFPAPSSGAAEAEPTRRPAVIVVTDLMDHSTTTLDDERAASALVTLMRQVVTEVAGACGGRVIERSRDLALWSFPTRQVPSRRAGEYSNGFMAQVTAAAVSTRLRAGVHTGEVLFAGDGGVTGRTVMVADRLRERAAGGEILLSDTVMAGLPKVLGQAVEDLGATKLRDVPEPQECFRLRLL